jgi:uncharacterized SAM-dependent methyltransferase
LSEAHLREFAAEVRADLSKPQKELHSKYLYDELGSALFEAITRLPEYGLTRADERLLCAHAGDIAEVMPAPAVVIELGSGTGEKTRHILSAFRDSRIRYVPIDVSSKALIRCQRDALLIGADLVKDSERMLRAYDDAIGLTAAFNLNLLGRINRELGGTFDLRNFQHEARWNEAGRRIEMHLRSTVEQTALVLGADLTVRFQAGETIWTESSHKFQTDELREMAGRTGYRVHAQWVDREWPFVESLWVAR